MTTPHAHNQLRSMRQTRGWSQAELAEKAGISRTAVTAIEGRQLVPSVAAAMSLARALGTTVEALFASGPEASEIAWACEPKSPTNPYWQAEVGGRLVRYPAHSTPMVTPLADSAADLAQSQAGKGAGSSETLVLACCDPAAGLLASLYAQSTGLRLLVLSHSSSEAIELLRQGLVHAAGIHLATDDDPKANERLVRAKLGPGYHLLRLARWQEGIAAMPSLKLRSVRGATRARLTWVGREPGSGARLCLDRLLTNRQPPRHVARHHRGVAEAVHSGWADAGICVRLASAEAGLDFLPVQDEAYDVCLAAAAMQDRRVQTLVRVVRSTAYRRVLDGLSGYSSSETGQLAAVN